MAQKGTVTAFDGEEFRERDAGAPQRREEKTERGLTFV
jgi:hypothetical protein